MLPVDDNSCSLGSVLSLAVANVLSLSVCGLDGSIMSDVLAAASDVLAEADASLFKFLMRSLNETFKAGFGSKDGLRLLLTIVLVGLSSVDAAGVDVTADFCAD